MKKGEKHKKRGEKYHRGTRKQKNKTGRKRKRKKEEGRRRSKSKRKKAISFWS